MKLGGFSSATRRRAFLLVLVLLFSAGGFVAWRVRQPEVHAPRSGRLVRFDVRSRLVGRNLMQVGLLPEPRPEGRRPLLVLLHGRGGSPDWMVSDALLEALDREGDRAPVVVLANGGESSYYHDRRTGEWGSYIVEEVIPAAVLALNADPSRVAIGGVSMGGFGALDIARVWSERFCAVGGHSAALWRTAGETPRGAFDDAQDFAGHDLFGSAERTKSLYGDTPVWIDVGNRDPFQKADAEFAQLLRDTGNDVTFHDWPGTHSRSYWRSHMGEYFDFYARSLAACGR